MYFVLIAVVVVIGLHVYLYRRLVHDVTARGRVRRWGGLVLGLLLASALGAFAGTRSLDPSLAVSKVLAYVGYIWLVLALYLAFVLVLLELPRLLAKRRGLGRRRDLGRGHEHSHEHGHDPEHRHDPEHGHDPERRRVLARLLAGVAGVLAVGTVGYGVAAAKPPRVVRREVTLDRLAPGLDGVTIAVLSDIHLGPINGRPFLADVVGQVNAERPDLVAIVGDLVDGTVAHLGPAAAALADLAAPSYFVTGNHEYFSGAQEWCDFLPTLGVRVLRNERVAVGRLGAGPAGPTFDLAGIDDRTAARAHIPGHGANLDQALAGRDPARPVVLLAHQPVMVDQSSQRNVDLQISGHTHGGQFLPLGYVVLLDQPVLAGLTRIGRTWLYVTRGVGFWGPPVRVGAPPEITLLTLRTPSP